MTQEYYCIVTDKGLTKEAQAGKPGGSPVRLTHMAVGDGGEAPYADPSSQDLGLRRELYRSNDDNPIVVSGSDNQLIIEGLIPENTDPLTIREVGVFDSDGDLFAIGKYPETFKPNSPLHSGKKVYIKMIIGFVSNPNVGITISENINLSSNFEANLNLELDNRLKVSENFADLNDAAIARDNLGLGSAALLGDASQNDKGVVQIATQAEVDSGTSDANVVTPRALANNQKNSFIHIQEQKPSGTNAGSFASGAWRTRGLNVVVFNTIFGASLDSNQLTLPSGTYEISVLAGGYDVGQHKAKLVNISDSIDVLIGLNADTTTATDITTMSAIQGLFTISSPKLFEIQHRCSNTKNTDGFGQNTNFSVVEVYCDVKIRKITTI
ncbi:MAG: hypothetical protein ACJAZX_000412 [Rickettsiales bacterium]|jgi:hypothetical protein